MCNGCATRSSPFAISVPLLFGGKKTECVYQANILPSHCNYNMTEGVIKSLTAPEGYDDVPHTVRLNAAGQVSVIDVITNVCFLGTNNKPISSARQSSLSYYNRIVQEYEDVKAALYSLQVSGAGPAGNPCSWTKWNVFFFFFFGGRAIHYKIAMKETTSVQT